MRRVNIFECNTDLVDSAEVPGWAFSNGCLITTWIVQINRSTNSSNIQLNHPSLLNSIFYVYRFVYKRQSL